MEPIYLDHAATTPLRPEVREVMARTEAERFGNPSSVHRWGQEARASLEESRERVAGVLGARMWGQLGDRFGGKGLMSIALLGLAIDPLWMLASLLVHPIFLVPSYALGGVFNSGWTIAQNMTLVRTSGHPADRIRVLAFYNVAFGLAAGTAPMAGGALLELLATTYSATAAYGALFALAATLRLHAYQHLRTMPAPPARRGRYVSTVVLRAVRRSAVRRTLGVRRLGHALVSTVSSTVATVLGAARGGV
jgi:MFS family permease